VATAAVQGLSLLAVLSAAQAGSASWFVVLAGLAIAAIAAMVRAMLRQRVGVAIDAQPPLVRVVRSTREELVAYGAVHPGDRIIVHAGERIPVDGELITERAKLRAAFGGRDVRAAAGDRLTSGDIAATSLVLEARAVGREATWSVVATALQRLSSDLPSSTRTFERTLLWVQIAWTVVALGVVVAVGRDAVDRSALVWLLVAGAWWLGPLLARGALGAWTVGLIVRGIIIKSWNVVEKSRRIRSAVVHKTGTLAAGTPMLLEVRTVQDGVTRNDLLRMASALEGDIDHPIARTIRRAAAATKLTPPDVSEAHLMPSAGVVGVIAGERVSVGSSQAAAAVDAAVPPDLATFADKHEAQGDDRVRLAAGERTRRARASGRRPTAAPFVQRLQRRGITVTLVSGDGRSPARVAAAAAGIDVAQVFAPVGTDEKAAIVRERRSDGVVVVADPTTDRRTLAEATVGSVSRCWSCAYRPELTGAGQV
jgi:cation transport ATPase